MVTGATIGTAHASYPHPTGWDLRIRYNKNMMPSTSSLQAPAPTSPHILLVEDDLFILDLLSNKLKQENYQLFIATDAEDAVKILEQQTIDLILLDILLPGKDGFTFLKELKADPVRQKIPVIILSNLGQKEEQERGMALGAVDYLIKANNSPAEIIARIQTFLTKNM